MKKKLFNSNHEIIKNLLNVYTKTDGFAPNFKSFVQEWNTMNRCNLHQKQTGFTLLKLQNTTPKNNYKKVALLLVSG